MDNSLRFAYITTSNKDEARLIGQKLIQSEYAACVNIIDGMESMYKWKGSIVVDTECILIAKTQSSKIDLLTQEVIKMHSSECPCILSFSPHDNEGNKDYLLWLLKTLNIPSS